MRVTIRCEDCVVEIEVVGGYAPDLADDVCRRAVQTYRDAFVAADEDDPGA